MTFSWWMKVCNLDSTGDPRGVIYESGYSGGGGTQSGFTINFSNQRLNIVDAVNNSGVFQVIFSYHFSDPSAWYNCVVVIDTTESTNTNRVKLFVNGTQQTDTDTANWPSEDATTRANKNLERIGAGDSSGSPYNHTNIYLADFNLIDGTALTPSSFGEFNNGIWIPIDTAGLTFGSKGWRLQFKETGDGQSTASSSTIGADTSGNNLHFNDNNMDTHDSNMADCPELNFCTINSLFRDVTANTLSEGDLKVVTSTSGRSYNAATFLLKRDTGKWWWEYRPHEAACGMGVARVNGANGSGAYQSVTSTSTGSGTTDYYYGENNWGTYQHDIVHNGSSVVSLSGSASYPEIYGVLVDTDASPPNLEYYVGGSAVGNIDLDAGYDFIPIIGDGSGGVSRTLDVNFGQNPTFNGNETAGTNTDSEGQGLFSQAVPSGAKCLCSANLPDVTLSPNQTEQGSSHFTTTLYTSDDIGAGGTQNVTGVGFLPDLVWIKNRDSNSTSHTWYDSTRGTGRHIASDSTAQEVGPNSIYGYLSAFGSDGFTLTGGTTNANYINQGTDKYVSWNWKANGGTTTTNDASATGIGTIDSTHQANTTSGFSIVSYTGTGSSGTIAHGLSEAPNLVWIKNRSSSPNGQWVIGNDQSGFTGQMYFDDGPFSSNSGSFGNTAPTSTVVNINTDNTTNESGDSFIMYCFHNVEGYQKIGSYEGNNNSNGAMVYTGFRPAWLMVKSLDTNGENFHIFDNTRATINVIKARLIADGSSAENTNDEIVDFLSNGFKWRDNNPGYNNAATFFYLAIAEAPFKFANSR